MTTLNQSLAERVQAVSRQAISEERIVGSVVLVAQHGKVVYAEASGYADREQQRPMQRETQFRLSSVSKPYITLAAMRMVEQHKLGLDDAVSRWLPWFTPALADGRRPEIKIRHLLSHTAGLDYRFTQPEDGPYQRLGIQDGMTLSSLTLEQNLRLLAQAELLAEPGREFHYSLSIDVLGAVLEAAAGESLPQLFNLWVAQPLGLGNTGFYTTDSENMATAYQDTAARPEPIYDGMQLQLPEGFGFDIDLLTITRV